ncbi:uncharacterized protein KQ657_002871 [Scheffersomyces spartinae]|uniref:MATE efflux family protein n=1 Tax=Scheffersomyces spartinae TaxID=45513 RepID=A0A9P7V5Q8_9ASCO|nr:uncharacterized protein KQ657_002871 [Scheffersomyces spartinae]KAG7191735.1 hypothetical protein KQ657_002871 [Scheffersomyces spartinae]
MVLFRGINSTLADPNTGFLGARRRRIFIPPLTQHPLFIYGDGEDQRSFLSNIETLSVLQDDSEELDAASVSSSMSYPLGRSSVHTQEDWESFNSWLVEEHQRRRDGDGIDAGATATTGADSDDDLKPLIQRRGSVPRSNYSYSEDVDDFVNLKTSFKIEFGRLLKHSVPLIMTFILEHVFLVVCLLVVGHLGKNELAAVSLASMTTTISFAVFEGMATALDTLCPQAYGAGNYELVSLHVQRVTLVSLILYIPFAILWWFSQPLLSLIIEELEVVELTTLFLRIMILGGPAYIMFETGKRFLQAQGIFEAGTIVLFISAPINVLLSYVLVWNHTIGLGYIGAPIATVINFWLMDLLFLLYVAFIDGKQCWFGIASTTELFLNWKILGELAVPGIVMLESEYLAYEIMTLIASYYGTIELAAQSAVSSIALIAYTIPFAVGIASSTRIANFIGGNNVEGAKTATKIGLICSILIGLINLCILYYASEYIAGLFTQDHDVFTLIVKLFRPLVACVEFLDSIASVSSGIMRAQGSQKIGGWINFISYYGFTMPLVAILNHLYPRLQLYGLWISLGIGMLVIGLSQVTIILTSNWEDIILRAHLFMDDDDDDGDYGSC